MIKREREGEGNFNSTTFTDKTLSTYHRVGRELSLFSSRRNWDSPNPSPAGECAPLPPRFWREGRTRWQEMGQTQESPNSDEGTYTVVLFIYTYFGVPI